MIKKSITRRIIIATLSLFVLLIVYHFPSKKDKVVNENDINYIEVEGQPIFFIDSNNLVARTKIVLKKELNQVDKAKSIIDSLIINSKNKDYIPSGFKAIIPENTRVIDLTIEDDLLKVNFTKDLLTVNELVEEKMLESIIYSLTELDNIKRIMIFVEGNNLLELPNSRKKLPVILTRDYGINKVVDLDKIKETTKTVIYYVAKNGDNYYNIPVTLINNDNKEKIEIIIDELKSNSVSEPNLISYLTASSELEDYEILENQIKLSFNKYLLDDLHNSNILEEVKYSLALSIKDNYGIDSLSIIVDNNEI
ncbi:MAG: GerMN domain-containing protein [Bacilli bacterium]|nr:GerMN domain-containing protein [Bacilli bacterium]